jgi:hypothetical protein
MTKTRAPGATVLDQRALNRALLSRQMLLERQPVTPLAAVEHLVGMQGQEPLAPYYGLWSRLETFDPHDLGSLVEEGALVRIACLRLTVHLVSARDCLLLRPAVQPMMTRALESSVWARGIVGVDRNELATLARTTVEETPMPVSELGKRLQERWPQSDAPSLGYAAHYLLPLVQLPPRAVWGRSGQVRCTTAEAWTGERLQENPDLDSIVLRYLGAFGPASVRDAQSWSGLTRFREVFERLRPRLLTFRDEHGTELFDLPEAPRPAADIEAPVRFLGPFDNVILGHADRRRIVDDESRKRLMTSRTMATFLVDGRVGGTWRVERKGKPKLEIQPYGRLSKGQRAEVEDEGVRFLQFAAGEAATDVSFAVQD